MITKNLKKFNHKVHKEVTKFTKWSAFFVGFVHPLCAWWLWFNHAIQIIKP